MLNKTNTFSLVPFLVPLLFAEVRSPGPERLLLMVAAVAGLVVVPLPQPFLVLVLLAVEVVRPEALLPFVHVVLGVTAFA